MNQKSERLSSPRIATTISFVIGTMIASTALAQMVNLQAPFQNTSDSFFESFGTSGNYTSNDGNFFFNWGGGNAIPPFGGFNPNNQANLGFQSNGSRGSFSLNLSMAQGSSRTNSVTTPSLTLMNGGSGSINSTINRPFVTSVIPVIGGGRPLGYVPVIAGQSNFQMSPPQLVYTNPLIQKIQRLGTEPVNGPDTLARIRAKARQAETQQTTKKKTPSSAEYGDISVAEIRAKNAQAKSATYAKVAEHIAKAEEYFAAEKYSLARYHYRYAWKRAPQSEKSRLKSKLDETDRLYYQQKQSGTRN